MEQYAENETKEADITKQISEDITRLETELAMTISISEPQKYIELKHDIDNLKTELATIDDFEELDKSYEKLNGIEEDYAKYVASLGIDTMGFKNGQKLQRALLKQKRIKIYTDMGKSSYEGRNFN